MAACKLCGGSTLPRFHLKLRGRYDAGYVQCEGCHSLQILEPTWLDEAYAQTGWAGDTGLVARNLLLAAKLSSFFACIGAADTPIVDFGGGTGLLTRMLRDMGWNAWAYEPTATPVFVDHFRRTDMSAPHPVVVASEVVEHFNEPKREWAGLLSGTDILIVTTELYAGQGPDWWYLAPASGQHVFFYTEAALHQVAAAHGFVFVNTGFLKFMLRTASLGARWPMAGIERGLRDAVPFPVSDDAAQQIVHYLRNPFAQVGRDHELERAAQSGSGAA